MFFKEYSNTTITAINFVKALNVQVNAATIEESIESHPDAGTLLSISDSLNKWNIPNTAAKIEVQNIDRLPVPFIAQLNYPIETVFTVVTSVSDYDVKFYSNERGKFVKQDKASFLEKFSGVVLIAEKSEHSGEPQYTRKCLNSIVKISIPILLTLLLSILYGFGIEERAHSAEELLMLPIMLMGAVLSVLLLYHEIDGTNPILNRVCSSIPRGNCHAVLNSKGAHIFSWLSWSEVGTFYFIGGLMMLLLCNTTDFLCLLSVLAMIYPVYSIVYQYLVVKRWCLLCLSVQVLLLVQGGLSVLLFEFPNDTRVLLESIKPAVFSYTLPALFWYIIKPFLLEVVQLRFLKTQYKRLKYNIQFFRNNLSIQQQVTDIPTGLTVGNRSKNFTHQIIAVCNPFCGHCGNAHNHLDSIIDENPEVQVKIIFTTPNIQNNPSYKIVKYFIELQSSKNVDMLKPAMTFWYNSQEYDNVFELMQQKFPVVVTDKKIEVGTELDEMFQWCDNVGITGTPTLFYDGYRLPDVYNVKDLDYFVKES